MDIAGGSGRPSSAVKCGSWRTGEGCIPVRGLVNDEDAGDRGLTPMKSRCWPAVLSGTGRVCVDGPSTGHEGYMCVLMGPRSALVLGVSQATISSRLPPG